MSTIVIKKWITDKKGNKVAPNTTLKQILNEDGSKFETSYQNTINEIYDKIKNIPPGGIPEIPDSTDFGEILIDTFLEYRYSDSPTELIGEGEWQRTYPQYQKNKYLWTRTRKVYLDKSKEDEYTDPVCISGPSGEQGIVGPAGKPGKDGYTPIKGKDFFDGAKITETITIYWVSDVDYIPEVPKEAVTETSTAVYNTWTKAMPELSDIYRYYFTALEYHYSDDTINWSEPVRNVFIKDVQKVLNDINKETENVKDSIGKITETTQNAQQAAQDAIDASKIAKQLADSANEAASQANIEVNDIGSELRENIENFRQEMRTDYATKNDLSETEVNFDSKIEQSAVQIESKVAADYSKKTDIVNIQNKYDTLIGQTSNAITLQAKALENITMTSEEAEEKLNEAKKSAQEAKENREAAEAELAKAQNSYDQAAQNLKDLIESGTADETSIEAAKEAVVSAEETLNQMKIEVEKAKSIESTASNLVEVATTAYNLANRITTTEAKVKVLNGEITSTASKTNGLEQSFTEFKQTTNAFQLKIGESAIINATTEYCLSDSETELVNPTDWSETLTAEKNKYIWQRSKTTKANNEEEYGQPFCIQGKTGKGISNIIEYYATSASDTVEPPDSEFSSNGVPEFTDEKKFLWNYEIITYTDNSTSATTKRVISVKGDSAKYITISSNDGQIFKKIKNENNEYTPSSITLTATLHGGLKGYKWYKDGELISNASSATGTQATYTVPSSSPGVYKCVSEGCSDEISIVQIEDGNDGTDAYTVILTNESHTFAGNTTSALDAEAECEVIAYKGATQIPVKIGKITGMPEGMSINETKSILEGLNAKFVITVTTSMTIMNGTLNVPIILENGSKEINKKFTYTLALKGNTGDEVIKYQNLYYTSDSENNPPYKPTTDMWIEEKSADTPQVWTIVEPTYNKNYPYYFVSSQTMYKSGNITSSDPSFSEGTTKRQKDLFDVSNQIANTMEFTEEGLQVGYRSSINDDWVGCRSKMGTHAFEILNQSGDILSSFGEKVTIGPKNKGHLCAMNDGIYFIDTDDSIALAQIKDSEAIIGKAHDFHTKIYNEGILLNKGEETLGAFTSKGIALRNDNIQLFITPESGLQIKKRIINTENFEPIAQYNDEIILGDSNGLHNNISDSGMYIKQGNQVLGSYRTTEIILGSMEKYKESDSNYPIYNVITNAGMFIRQKGIDDNGNDITTTWAKYLSDGITLGDENKYHTIINNSGMYFLNGGNSLATYGGSTITLGDANSKHVEIDTDGFRVKDGTRTDWDDLVLIGTHSGYYNPVVMLGKVNQPHLYILKDRIEFGDAWHTHVLSKFTNNSITLGTETGNHTYIDENGIKLKNGDLILGQFVNNGATIGNQAGSHIKISENQIKLSYSKDQKMIIGNYVDPDFFTGGTIPDGLRAIVAIDKPLLIKNAYSDNRFQNHRKAYIAISASDNARYDQEGSKAVLELGTKFGGYVSYTTSQNHQVDNELMIASTAIKISSELTNLGTYNPSSGKYENCQPERLNTIEIGQNDFDQININGKVEFNDKVQFNNKIIDSRENSVICSRVLYNGSTAGTGGTVTLSESASNFDYIEIYFCNTVYDDSNSSHTAYDMTKVYSPNGKYALLFTGYYPASGVNMQIIERLVLISGTSITQASCRYSNLNPGVSGGAVNNYNKIYKVVGYK